MGQFCYCSLSPQGDDNNTPYYYDYNKLNCSLSPQGDDNSFAIVRLLRSRIAAYPRKGTITHKIDKHTAAVELQLIPARGR